MIAVLYRAGSSGGMISDMDTEALRRRLTELEAAVESQRDAYLQVSRLNRRLESARDEERRLLSRELHDELGQMLTALKLRLKMMGRGAGGASGVEAARVDDAVALVDGLIDRVRKISVDLRPPLLDELGLESALRAFLDSRAKLAATQLHLDASGLRERLDPEIEMTCFRIVQEAVTNVLRHASAERAVVRIRYEDERLTVAIIDDGRGVSREQAHAQARAGRMGLIDMRERARSLGGDFALTSPPSSGQPSGTRIDVTLPARPIQAGTEHG